MSICSCSSTYIHIHILTNIIDNKKVSNHHSTLIAFPHQNQNQTTSNTSYFPCAEARQSILSQILEPEASDRLNRIRLVKASRAEEVEDRLIMLARSGQLRSKVTETQLKELLGAVSEKKEAEEKITVSRRKGGWEDEDDDLDF